jgi:hypothetical protein
MYPVAAGASVKLLRGETNEVPTPLAACKAVRSVLCPSYLKEVIAGAEGAVILLAWQETGDEAAAAAKPQASSGHGTSSTTSSSSNSVHDVVFAPSSADADGIDESLPIRVQEGDVYCCTIRFQRSSGPSVSSVKTYVDSLFGEVGVVIEGSLGIVWQSPAATVLSSGSGPDDKATGTPEREQLLRVDATHEYGPFYLVDGNGHLVHAPSGGLMYVPHRFVLNSSALWATVRFPLGTSEVAGPHRHCYT